MSGRKNKKLFYLAKAAALAEAIINTSQAVTKAYAQGGVWGVVQGTLLAILGGIQIGKIAAQNLAAGGRVLGYSSHDRDFCSKNFKEECMKKSLFIVVFILFTSGVSFYAWSAPKAIIVVSDILGATGIGFDDKNNMYTVGTIKEQGTFRRVLWMIDENLNKTQFAEITDAGDRLGAVGVAWHSKALNGLVVDGNNNIWLTSGQPCACFLVTNAKRVIKLYLNTDYNLAAQWDTQYPYGPPYGIAWDNDSRSVYLVTTGPETGRTEYSIHINKLTEADISELSKSGNLGFIPNTGWSITKQSVMGLFKGINTPLHALRGKALYRFDDNGNLIKFGPDIAKGIIQTGVVDEKGNIYLAANVYLGKSSEDPMETLIYKVDKNGTKILYFKAPGDCTGLAYKNKYLYFTDSKKQSIYKLAIN